MIYSSYLFQGIILQRVFFRVKEAAVKLSMAHLYTLNLTICKGKFKQKWFKSKILKPII